MENEGPDFFFFNWNVKQCDYAGRRRPPARCDKPQACSTHYSENAVGGLPRLMELMTVIALGNLSFSLLCARVCTCVCIFWVMKLCQINLRIHLGNLREILYKCGFLVIVQGTLNISESSRSRVKLQWFYLLFVWLELHYLTLLTPHHCIFLICKIVVWLWVSTLFIFVDTCEGKHVWYNDVRVAEADRDYGHPINHSQR